MANRIDLHTHSTVSDGLLSPADLVRAAARDGVTALALTDHDTIGGVQEAIETGREAGIEVVPGVELGTSVERREHHILGYFVDDTLSSFLADLDELASRRVRRATLMVERLAEAGIPITLDEVLAEAGHGTVGRPHLARVLIAHGHASDVGDAFEKFLKAGRPAYVPRQPFPPEEAIDLILRAGGVPVLAHPYSTGDPAAAVARLKPAGLLGLEVYYGEYDDDQRASLRALADRTGLIPTGGSDFHGYGYRAGRDLGGPPVPADTVERLRRAAASAAPGHRAGSGPS
jgi:predicted metal-dependent phosphoesterase TrpH